MRDLLFLFEAYSICESIYLALYTGESREVAGDQAYQRILKFPTAKGRALPKWRLQSHPITASSKLSFRTRPLSLSILNRVCQRFAVCRALIRDISSSTFLVELSSFSKMPFNVSMAGLLRRKTEPPTRPSVTMECKDFLRSR